MRTVFVGAGACFANIMTDVLAKVDHNAAKNPMWRLLAEVIKYEGIDENNRNKHDIYYFDSGPELSREERNGQMFTYNISSGNMLSGAGNIMTAQKFWKEKGDKMFRQMRTDIGDPKPDLFISVRGCGATNCGSGFLLDRNILERYTEAVIIQFLILPHRGEGIEASRVVYAISQAAELLQQYPDRYTCVIISNERILLAAKSFEAMGENWFYPLANQVVADIIARVLYPTFYEHFRSIVEGFQGMGGMSVDDGSREKYLDVRDFVRQPGFRTVEFAHALDVEALDEEAIKAMVKKMGTEMALVRYGDSEPMIYGSLGKMEQTTALFTMFMGPKGKVGDMTKVCLAEALEDAYLGAFPKVYVYDILTRGFELLVFPSGGIPEDVTVWFEKFNKKLSNPRYAQVVEQYCMDMTEILRLYEKVATYLQFSKPELILSTRPKTNEDVRDSFTR
jgi:hypothetical protein